MTMDDNGRRSAQSPGRQDSLQQAAELLAIDKEIPGVFLGNSRAILFHFTNRSTDYEGVTSFLNFFRFK
jgi:hypothetical protein